MSLKIIQNDIIKLQVDATANAANVNLKRGGGVCGAIFSIAGADKLQEECNRIGSEPFCLYRSVGDFKFASRLV